MTYASWLAGCSAAAVAIDVDAGGLNAVQPLVKLRSSYRRCQLRTVTPDALINSGRCQSGRRTWEPNFR